MHTPQLSAEDEVLAGLAGIVRSGWSHDSRVFAKAITLILKKDIHMSKELDDLTASVGRINDAITAAVADIQALAQQVAAGQANNDGAAIEDAVGKLNGLADTLNAAVSPPPADTTTPAAA